MTTLRQVRYAIPAASLGPENPLPMFRGAELDARMEADASLPEEERRYLGWRTAWRVLPHRVQDSYDRRRVETELPAVVLENAHLRATFLPGYGGRLVSLIRKPENRELLSCNSVFQPANLALRNAWFSGGIEWNVGGPPGHHVLTCSPVFAVEIEGVGGAPALRLYEWDRALGFTWQIDFHLPMDSALLFAHVRLVNPHPREIPIYWWTNIAVDEREDVRVLVPADKAMCHGYGGRLDAVDLPISGGRDLTYSTRAPHAADFFSRISEGQRRWIAALDAAGSGLFETSTDRLRGRKLFCWGMGSGGRQWQEYLAVPGAAYIEIQAGLGRTQMECVPMPARAEWSWTEAFGMLKTDAALVHGGCWEAATRATSDAIERALPAADMQRWDREFGAVTSRSPLTPLAAGSGWGALERRRSASPAGSFPFAAATPFNDVSLGPDQAPWAALLSTGVLPEGEPSAEPGALMTQPEWLRLLEDSVLTDDGDHWLAWWHIGNARMEAGDAGGARAAWCTSMERHPTAWALRNLAVLAEHSGDAVDSCRLMAAAWSLGPPAAALAQEYTRVYQAAGRHVEVLKFVRSLSEDLRSRERILLAWAQSALATGELEGVEAVFQHDFAGIREGEVSLTDLWFAWHEYRAAVQEGVAADADLKARIRRDYPPPRRIDFRMAVGDE